MFSIPVQVPGLERRRKSIGLLHIIAGFFLVANASSLYRVLTPAHFWWLVPLYLLAIAAILYGSLRKRVDPSCRYNFPLRLLQAFGFLCLALAFTFGGTGATGIVLYLWVVIAGMLAFTEKMALQEPAVRIGTNGIDFPAGFSRKLVGWNAVADVTLRPDFLTLHYPDNRILQFELVQSLSAAETRNVQDFCRRHTAGVVAGGQS